MCLCRYGPFSIVSHHRWWFRTDLNQHFFVRFFFHRKPSRVRQIGHSACKDLHMQITKLNERKCKAEPKNIHGICTTLTSKQDESNGWNREMVKATICENYNERNRYESSHRPARVLYVFRFSLARSLYLVCVVLLFWFMNICFVYIMWSVSFELLLILLWSISIHDCRFVVLCCSIVAVVCRHIQQKPISVFCFHFICLEHGILLTIRIYLADRHRRCSHTHT